MTNSFEQRVRVERLPSGLDVALLPTQANDLVIARIALGIGSYSVYDRQAVVALLSDLLPSGTTSMKRSRVREQFELLGASVGVRIGHMHIYAYITSRKESFIPALTLLADVLAHPNFTAKEFAESKTVWLTALENEKESTLTQADTALSRALFDEGHPQWSHTIPQKIHAMAKVERDDVVRLYPSLLSTIGGLITVAGDIDSNRLVRDIERVTKVLPSRPLTLTPQVHPEKIRYRDGGKDLIVTCKDKMNIDTLLGIPLTLTKYDDDFEPLAMGVAILGSSSSSRLFNELRTRKSLTYGAYASLDGFGDGYPGYLSASAVFPSDVFLKGREALREVVRIFSERGVTAGELSKRKDEVLGRHVVGLSTSAGLAGIVFDTLIAQRPLSYIDTIPIRLRGISLARVNAAIRKHIRYTDAVTASSGGIDAKGKPLS